MEKTTWTAIPFCTQKLPKDLFIIILNYVMGKLLGLGYEMFTQPTVWIFLLSF